MRLAAAALLLTLTAGSAARADEVEVRRGAELFGRAWRTAAGADGIGPLFAARSCADCHPGGEAGRPDSPALVFRTGGEPRLGEQLQTRALPGVAPEPSPDAVMTAAAGLGRATPRHRWHYAVDGRPVAARLAPGLRGLGLLARIAAAKLSALADPEDHDGDGVSGRVRWLGTPQGRRPGRFGLKAESADLGHQVSRALALDMGVASARFPAPAGDCTTVQADCRAQAGTGTPVATAAIQALTTYLEALRPRPLPPLAHDPRGSALFADLGCATCHVGSFVVSSDPGVTGRPIERIAPFTDLLLHDVGPELAEAVDLGDGLSAEWRTAPLWGLRYRPALLHDGRASRPDEAVLWHGGEAERSRDRFLDLSAADRDALLTFLARL